MKEKTEEKRAVIFAAALIGIFFAAQCIYCFVPHPILAMGDEVIYKQLAFEIYELKPVSSFHYPIIYPLLLAPAAALGNGGFYYGMIFLNIVYKAALLAVISRLLQKWMKGKAALYVLALIAFSPSMFIWSKYVMSENIMAPLLVVVILYYINYQGLIYDGHVKNRRKVCCTIAAASLAVCLYWTKYLSLVLFPVFFLYWTGFLDIRRLLQNRKWKQFMGTAALFLSVVAGYIIGYAWIHSLRSGIPMSFSLLKESMGFSIGSGPSNSGYFLLPEFRWSTAYLLYVFLGIAVLLPVFVLRAKRIFVKYPAETIFFALFAAALIFVSARHSTYGGLVNGMMIKLLGRYTAYISLFLYILWGKIISEEDIQEGRVPTKLLKRNAVFAGVELLALYVSYHALYGGVQGP